MVKFLFLFQKNSKKNAAISNFISIKKNPRLTEWEKSKVKLSNSRFIWNLVEHGPGHSE